MDNVFMPDVQTFYKLIEHCADVHAHKTAVWFVRNRKKVIIDYCNLKSDIDALGAYFRKIGIKDCHVAIVGENSYEWILAYFSAVISGNIVVPLDITSGEDTLIELMHKADVDYVIHSDDYVQEAQNSGLKTIPMKSFASYIETGNKLRSENYAVEWCKADPEEVCTIVFTSGTTGQPKGVMLTQQNIVTDTIAICETDPVCGGAVSILPFYHAFGFVSSISCIFWRGYSLFISSSMKKIISDIAAAEPGHLSLVPMLAEGLYPFFKKVALTGGDWTGPKAMNVGGAPISETLIDRYREIGIRIINGYGITECAPIVAANCEKPDNSFTVGNPILCNEVRISDPDGSGIGEVQVKGSNVFKGYYKDMAATEAAFDDGWFKTGDLGYLDENNCLYITGRIKNLIILSNGKNVSPETIETKLISLAPEIKELIVYDDNDRIVAEIYTEADRNDIRKRVHEFNRGVPTYMQIAEIRFRDEEFSKTTTKKIKRH